MRRLVPLVLALAILVGCDDTTSPVVTEAEEGTVEPIEQPVDDRCEEGPDDLVTTLAGGLTVEAELLHVQVVESEDLTDTTFVSAVVEGADLDSDEPIGTWAVVGGDVVSVNAVARDLSDWPDGTVEHGLAMDDDGGEESKECVDARLG